MNAQLSFGLDVGGGVSKVAYFVSDKLAKPVPDLAGNEVFQTAVYKDAKTGELLFSNDALNAGIADPQGLATDYKRHMGDDTKRFFHGTASAKDVAVLFLKHIRERVAAVTGQTVTACCVTTPFVWADNAKRNYLAALAEAGLKPIPSGVGGVGILSEPTAAALAYADLKNLGDRGVLIYVVDVGSTTTDVSLVYVDKNTAQVLGGHGDPNLGGFNILHDLVELVLQSAVKEGILKPADLAKVQTLDENRVALLRSVEEAMKALANRADTRIPIAFGSKPGLVKITREQYERDILEKYLVRIGQTIDRAKANAIASGKLKADAKPDYLVPVGGPCRNPYLRNWIAKHVGTPAKTDIDPIFAIAMGAAKHAYWLIAQRNEGQGSLPGIIRPKEVVPHDIGVMVKESISAPLRSLVIFQKGQKVPHSTTINLSLLEDHQTAVTCQFVQCDGDGQLLESCSSLGEVTLKGLPLEAVRTARVQITAHFDEAAMVTMEVKDVVSGQCRQVQFAAAQPQAEQKVA